MHHIICIKIFINLLKGFANIFPPYTIIGHNSCMDPSKVLMSIVLRLENLHINLHKIINLHKTYTAQQIFFTQNTWHSGNIVEWHNTWKQWNKTWKQKKKINICQWSYANKILSPPTPLIFFLYKWILYRIS